MTLKRLPLFLVLSMISTQIAAWTVPRECFEFEAELLLLRPSVGVLDYVIVDQRPATTLSEDSLPLGQSKCLNPGLKPGFSLALGYLRADRCKDVVVRYTHHHQRYQSFVNAEGDIALWPTFGPPPLLRGILSQAGDSNQSGLSETYARAHAAFDYDSVDLQFGRRLSCDKTWLRAFAGIHYVHLRNDFNVTYFGNLVPAQSPAGFLAEETQTRRVTWAIGPQLGLEGFFHLPACFAVKAKGVAGVLSGRRSGSYFAEANGSSGGAALEITSATLSVDVPSTIAVCPYGEIEFGLAYERLFHRVRFKAEVGYAFYSYVNALAMITFNDARGTQQQRPSSYALDGWYLSLLVQI